MDSSFIQLKINNRPYSYDSALTIFQACLQKKIYVPRFCYHVALKIAGNCRMCLVEEKSSLKPVASCAVSIVAGMHIYTQTEMVKKAREGVIEYLLINHPLDCPICDQGGECDLQDQTMVFGADRGRFYENKRTTANKNLGFLIKTYLNRCIHCARCTRFLQDLAGYNKLSLLGRGYRTEISTYTEEFLKTEVSGNIIDLCPVGALTSKPYAFKARPWELASVYMYDIAEPFGSNIELNYRGLELLRILPRINYQINGEWISDKTRFFYDSFMIQRLSAIYFIKKNLYSPSSWPNFFNLFSNVFVKHHSTLRMFYSTLVEASYGEYADLESCEAEKQLSFFLSSQFAPLRSYDFSSSIHGRGYEKYFFSVTDILPKRLFLLNTNLRLESPVLNIKVRRLVVESSVSVFLVGFHANLNYEIKHLSLLFNRDAILNLYALGDNTAIICGAISDLTSLGNLSLFTSLYKTWKNIGSVSVAHVKGKKSDTKNNVNQLRFFIGQPELSQFSKTGFLIALLHHVEDSFWANFKKFSAYKLPTKFYLEKLCSYYSESGYFFSTIVNLVGYTIRGTKEEWKILGAILEKFSKCDTTLTSNLYLSAQSFGRRDVFSLGSSTSQSEISLRSVSSPINNYYSHGMLSRISPVLSLCAKAYATSNNYKVLMAD